MISLLIPKIMDMGLDVLDIQPYFISAKKGDNEYTFGLMVKDYYKEGSDYLVNIDETDVDFIILVIRNKPNDNVVLLQTSEINHGKVSLLEIRDKIKKKWQWEINRLSTT